MSDVNRSLPGSKNIEKVSVNKLAEQLEQAREQANQLAIKANRIYRAFHKDDELKTDVYEAKDFLKDNYVVIPDEVKKLFDKSDEELKKKETNNAPTTEDLQKSLNKEKVKFDPDKDIKENNVMKKILKSFGMKDLKPETVEIQFGDVKWLFEKSNSFIANFALAYAASEGIGNLDFGYSVKVATVALSLLEVDGTPITKLFEISDKYERGQDVPLRIRKVCAVKTVDLFLGFENDILTKFMQEFSDKVGFTDLEDEPKNNIVDLVCPICHKVKQVELDDDGKYFPKYCEDDGTLMVLKGSLETDNDIPLA